MKVDSIYNPGSAMAFLALALALAVAFVAASSAEGSDASAGDRFSADGIVYEVLDEGSRLVEIVDYDGSPEHVHGTVIHDGNEWTVASVASDALRGCISLQTVDLPSATSLGEGAFYGCGLLESSGFSDALESIGDYAFSVSFYSGDELLTADAGSLKGRMFKGSGDGNLYESFSAASSDGKGDILYRVTDRSSHKVEIVGYAGSPIEVSDTVSYMGSEWTVASVGKDAFSGCVSLEYVYTNNATSVGDRAFYQCGSLKEVHTYWATSVGDRAFYQCGSLEYVYLSDVTVLGDFAFYQCVSLKEAYIFRIATVGDSVFYGCASLEYVDMSSATTIGDGAFYGCNALSYVEFSDALESVGEGAFSVSFFRANELLAADADSLRGGKFLRAGDGKLSVHFSVASPDGGGELVCRVTDLDSYEVEIVGYSGSPAELSGSFGFNGSTWTVVSVGYGAFQVCGSLQTVDLPKATSVGANAFYLCGSLTTADLPSATSVERGAFFGCGSLEYVDMSSSTTIGDSALYRCDALKHVRFSDALASVVIYAFTVSFYSGSEQLAVDADSLRGRTFTGDGDRKLYESFEISWLDDSGALADTTFARKGETPSHDGLTKKPTDRCSYEFAGWVPDLAPAYGKASYTAVFDAAVRAYPVPVAASPSGYGKVSASEIPDVPYGTALPAGMYAATISLGGATVTATPAKADAYVYSFVRWEASGLVDGATGTNTILTAVFDRTPASDEKIRVDVVVTKASGSATSTSFAIRSGIAAVADGTSLALGSIRIANPIPQDDERYTYSFSGWYIDGAPLPDGEAVIDSDCVISSSIVATERSYEVAIVAVGGGSVSQESVAAPYRAAVYAEGSVLHVGDEAVTAIPADLGEDFVCVFLRWEVPSVQVKGQMDVSAVFEARPLTFVVDSVVYRIVSEGEVSVIGFEGAPASLSVPAVVEHGGTTYKPISIADSAFAGCATVTSVSIGDSVASIGAGALDCPYLRSVEVSSGNSGYSSVAGVLYDKGVTTLIKFPASKQRLIIPGTVTEISAEAFKDAGAALKADHDSGPISYFRYVSIPASVTRIGEEAFAGSTLEVLKFADRDGVEATDVGSGAFSGCSSLDYVVFPSFLLSAGQDSFSGCVFSWEDGSTSDRYTDDMRGHKFTGTDAASLEVYVPAAGGTFHSGTFAYRIVSSDESKEVVLAGFADGASEDKLYIPDSVKYLGFDWKVTSVGAKAFMEDDSIASVFSTVDIGFKAFANCQGLEIAVIDGGSIGEYAFASCRSLWFIGLEAVTQIGESSFSGCAGLTNADLSGVASIGKHAFYGCALTLADLSSAASIGYGAFTGNDLQKAVFGDGLSDVDPKAFFGYAFKGPDGGRVDVSASDLAGKAFEGSGKVLVQTS